MIRRPPSSTLFPTRRSSDLEERRVRHQRAPAAAPARFELLGDGIGGDRCGQLLGRLEDQRRRELDRLGAARIQREDRKSTRLNSSHVEISYAVFCLKKKKKQ